MTEKVKVTSKVMQANTYDAYGDIYTYEQMVYAKEYFDTNNLGVDFEHDLESFKDISIVDSYIDGDSWYITTLITKSPMTEDLISMIDSGEVTGMSVTAVDEQNESVVKELVSYKAMISDMDKPVVPLIAYTANPALEEALITEIEHIMDDENGEEEKKEEPTTTNVELSNASDVIQNEEVSNPQLIIKDLATKAITTVINKLKRTQKDGDKEKEKIQDVDSTVAKSSITSNKSEVTKKVNQEDNKENETTSQTEEIVKEVVDEAKTEGIDKETVFAWLDEYFKDKDKKVEEEKKEELSTKSKGITPMPSDATGFKSKRDYMGRLIK